jgi:hypothetical protein
VGNCPGNKLNKEANMTDKEYKEAVFLAVLPGEIEEMKQKDLKIQDAIADAWWIANKAVEGRYI